MAHWRWHGVRSQSSRGGGTKSENTDQATEFVKVQSRNSQRYNPSLPLFLPHMKTAFPAVFCACFNFLLQYQQVPQVTFISAWQRQWWDDQHKPWYYSTWKRHSVEYARRPWSPKFKMNRAILIVHTNLQLMKAIKTPPLSWSTPKINGLLKSIQQFLVSSFFCFFFRNHAHK